MHRSSNPSAPCDRCQAQWKWLESLGRVSSVVVARGIDTDPIGIEDVSGIVVQLGPSDSESR
jgi:hypothetical protein